MEHDAEQELTDEQASRKALEHAQTYERRLLKAGHRDIVSPLVVKRRLKPRITLSQRATAENLPKTRTAVPSLLSYVRAH
jgi:hypothetical protein